MIHPHTNLKEVSDTVGLGVFTTEFIPKGTIIFVLDKLDLILRPGNPVLHDPEYVGLVQKYSYVDASGDRILSWDHAKYMNHSCNPNTMSTAWGFDITVEDVPAGTELTCEYGLLNIEHEMVCACGEPECRLVVKPSDIYNWVEQWDEKIKHALPFIPLQPQPLDGLLKCSVKNKVKHYLETGKVYKSVKEMVFTTPVLNGQSLKPVT